MQKQMRGQLLSLIFGPRAWSRTLPGTRSSVVLPRTGAGTPGGAPGAGSLPGHRLALSGCSAQQGLEERVPAVPEAVAYVLGGSA